MRFRANDEYQQTAQQLLATGLTLIGFLVLLYQPILSWAQDDNGVCGSLNNAYGPYDFRNDRDKLSIVTGAHFTPPVEALIRGVTNTTPGADIDYTLRAIPNHPNALIAMLRLGEKEKLDSPRGSRYTVECWFERAIRFRADDQVVRMIYATFLNSKQRKPEAMQQLEVVKSVAGDNPFTHYNLGMLYADLKEYDAALAQAHRAAALGFTQPALREKLRAVGQWSDPVATLPVPEAEPQASQSAK
jgi:tetratricopeptide (TPR) repeat protein